MLTLPVSTTFVCAFLVGLVVALWERIPWILHERLYVPEETARRWQTWFYLPLAIFFPVAGRLVDGSLGEHVGVIDVLAAGILVLALSLAWLGQHRGIASGLLAVLGVCLAAACITIPTLALLPKFLAPLHLSYTACFNVGFVAVSLGILLGPRLIDLYLGRFNFRTAFLLLALLCLIPIVLVVLLDLNWRESFSIPQPPSDFLAFTNDPRWWLLVGLGLFFFPLLELSLAWRRGYEQQETTKASRLAQPGFWIAFLAGPIVAAWFIHDFWIVWCLVGLTLIHLAFLGNLAGAYGVRTGGDFGFWLAGATLAPILPTILAIPSTLAIFSSDHHSVIGLMLGAGCFGTFGYKLLAERFLAKRAVTTVMHFAMGQTLVLGIVALGLALTWGDSENYAPRPRLRNLFHKKEPTVERQKIKTLPAEYHANPRP